MFNSVSMSDPHESQNYLVWIFSCYVPLVYGNLVVFIESVEETNEVIRVKTRMK